MCQGHAVDSIVGGGATSAYWAGVPLMIKGRGHIYPPPES